MTDNPHYNLARRIEAARQAADTSIDPAVHAYKNALEGVAAAEKYALERAAHLKAHGTPDSDSFPPPASVADHGQPGEFLGPIEIDPRLGA